MSAPKKAIRTADGRTLALTIGSDADLATEDVRLSDGTQVTDATVDDLAEDLLDAAGLPLPEHLRRAGRPSLSGESRHSPHVSFRVPQDLRAKAEAEATRRGMSISRLAREALESYLAGV